MQQRPASLSIKQWSDADKPREKLRLKGRKEMTNAELIAIVIGSGSRQESALQLAQRILQTHSNDLNNIAQHSVEQLTRFKGIGEAKAIKILAALEIGYRRRFIPFKDRYTIKNSMSAYRLLQAELCDLSHEEFWVVYLNNSNRVLKYERLSRGGINGTVVDIRLVMKKALELSAVSLILAHNHPSGTTTPSKKDKELTLKIIQAAISLEIKVWDHLIITQESYFSFADNKLI